MKTSSISISCGVLRACSQHSIKRHHRASLIPRGRFDIPIIAVQSSRKVREGRKKKKKKKKEEGVRTIDQTVRERIDAVHHYEPYSFIFFHQHPFQSPLLF